MNSKVFNMIMILFLYFFFYGMFGYIELSLIFGTLFVAPLFIASMVVNGKKRKN